MQLVCGDALDPPLAPDSFQRVASLNVMDAVQSAHQHLSVVDGLCVPGGEVVLSSPFNWQSGIVAEDGRLDAAGPSSCSTTCCKVAAGFCPVMPSAKVVRLRWRLRRDGRSAVSYFTHYLRAHKRGQLPRPT